MKYIALLRGINVGGNNKVEMPRLREAFERHGFDGVQTYINSGNVLFRADEDDTKNLAKQCFKIIEKEFSFSVAVVVISADELTAALKHAPSWWDKNKEDKNNALFLIDPATPDRVAGAVGEAKPEYEMIASYGSVIFWTAPLKTFGRTRYSKVVGTDMYQYITIRNANTTKKLAALAVEME